MKVGVFAVDVSDAERVKKVEPENDALDNDTDTIQAAAAVEEQIGPIACLVSNAGIIHKSPCLMKNGKIEVRD